MKPMKTLGFAGAIFLAAGAAQAAPIVLDFEGVGNGASVNSFYNGGTDSEGNSGTNYGVSFSSPAIGLIDSDAGGSGVIANEPSPDTVFWFPNSDFVTMNVAAGFDTGLSFFYTNVSQPGSVTIYDGLNRTGNILATLTLLPVGTDCPGDPTGSYCAWVPVGTTFSGTARSVKFEGVPGYIGFDNITLGYTGVSVPEPGTLALLGAGLAGLGLVRRRRRAA